MNKPVRISGLSSPRFVLNSVVLTSLLFAPMMLGAKTPASASLTNSPKAVLDEAWQIVNREYVDGTFNHVDWQAVRQSLLGQEYSSAEEAYAALRQELRRLDDPYTRFLNPQQYAELTDQTSGEVSGIGVQVRRDAQTGEILIVSTLEGSPAAQAGIRAGDRLLMVDGQSTERLSVEGVSRLIRGEDGSQITLTISRDGGSPRTIILTRSRIELATVVSTVKQQNGTQIGYIRLTEFNAHASEQMQAAITSLLTEGVEGFVLDLRGNPGGLLQASIEISRMWLQRGAIVRTVDREGASEEVSANRTALTQLPLAVLVDGYSASSSEILTGALRDNNRAMVIGTTTYGKALVQSLHSLSDGSGLAVTVAHYYTPNGTDISRKGITPDIEVDLTEAQRRDLRNDPSLLGTASDPQYTRAMATLEATILARRQTGGTSATEVVPSSSEPRQVGGLL